MKTMHKIKILFLGYRKFKFKDLLRWILWRYEIVKRDSKERVFHLKDGQKFYFRPDVCSGAGFFQELFLNNPYFKHYSPKSGDVIVDIGAHIGLFCIPTAFYNDVHVFAFEPSPVIYALLKRNVTLNGVGDKITTRQMGISDSEGDAPFYASDLINGSTTFEAVRGDFPRERYITVPVTTLERILENIACCDFLKMDCEGAEFSVILSAPRSVFKKIRNMAIEYHSSPCSLAERLEQEGGSGL